MTLIKCGTKAYLGNIEGWIGGIEITYSNVLYKFSFIDNTLTHKFMWLHEKEMQFEEPKKQRIGYRK